MEFFLNSINLVFEDGPEILQKIGPSAVLDSRTVVARLGQCIGGQLVSICRVITRIDLRSQVVVGVGWGQRAPGAK